MASTTVSIKLSETLEVSSTVVRDLVIKGEVVTCVDMTPLPNNLKILHFKMQWVQNNV